MTDCTKYEDLCSALLDGEISREEKRALEAHLAECPACAAYLEDLRFMRESWHALEEPGPATLHEDIMASITAEANKNVIPAEKRRRPLPVFTILAAAAACVMLVGTGALGNLFTGGTSGSSASPAMADAAAAAPASSGAAMDGGENGAGDADAVPRVQLSEATLQAAPFAAADGAEDQPAEESDDALKALELPESLSQQMFAACYVAVGEGELPVLEEATLIEKRDDTSFFKVENNMNRLEKVSETLAQADYQMTLREDLGVQIDGKAADVLLIVVQN